MEVDGEEGKLSREEKDLLIASKKKAKVGEDGSSSMEIQDEEAIARVCKNKDGATEEKKKTILYRNILIEVKGRENFESEDDFLESDNEDECKDEAEEEVEEDIFCL